MTLDAHPIVGPHIPVGENVFTYRISAAGVELKNFEHLRGPNKYDFPRKLPITFEVTGLKWSAGYLTTLFKFAVIKMSVNKSSKC
ncbi:hypothetical protein AB4Z33_30525 [Paenibacillus sp. 2TAB19]